MPWIWKAIFPAKEWHCWVVLAVCLCSWWWTHNTSAFHKHNYIHPGRLKWNLQITHLERENNLQTSMSMFHANPQGCILPALNIATENEWLKWLFFFFSFGKAYFQGCGYVSFREGMNSNFYCSLPLSSSRIPIYSIYIQIYNIYIYI